MSKIDHSMNSIKFADPNIYGIDWNIDDEGNTKKVKPQNKSFCEWQVEVGEGNASAYLVCLERVSTERGRPKPYCADHVFENLYVQDLLKRYYNIDHTEELKRVKTWEKEHIGP
jgi:hypothetical protein